jgi:pilus assembly protein CpaE
MSRIVLATASADLEERVHQATDGAFLSLPLGPLPPDPAHVFAHLDQLTPPKVVVLDAGAEPKAALELAARFDAQCPVISVILVSEPSPEVSLAAMRAGVRDILHPAADISDIRQALDHAFQAAVDRALALEGANGAQSAENASVKTGKVITIVSPKGGVGKTTVATNVAVGLARTAPHSTVLVDLDVQFGDVASALDLEPEYSLPDAVHGPASRDAMVLKTFLTQHETGLYVICGPRTPADADGISGLDVSQLLQMLASEFGYVVVDTAPGLSDHTLAALDQTTDLVLLTSMDVPGVRGLRKELDTLNQLNLLAGSRHVVLNFTDTRAGLSVADVEATIGGRVDVRLPRSRAIQASVNQGLPLLQNGARDPMVKQLRGLVSRFTPAPLPKPKPERASRKSAKAAAAPPPRTSRQGTQAAAAPAPQVSRQGTRAAAPEPSPRAGRQRTKVAQPKPRRAAGHWYRGRWAGAS